MYRLRLLWHFIELFECAFQSYFGFVQLIKMIHTQRDRERETGTQDKLTISRSFARCASVSVSISNICTLFVNIAGISFKFNSLCAREKQNWLHDKLVHLIKFQRRQKANCHFIASVNIYVDVVCVCVLLCASVHACLCRKYKNLKGRSRCLKSRGLYILIRFCNTFCFFFSVVCDCQALVLRV